MNSLLEIPTAELAVKSLVFAAFFLLLLHMLKRRGSGTRQVVCLAGSFLLFLLPWGQLLPRFETAALDHALPVIPVNLTQAPHSPLPEASLQLVSLVWLTGTGILLLRLAAGMIALHHRRARGREFAANLARRCSRLIGLRHTPSVLLSGSVRSPAVAGIIKPGIFLPLEATEWPEERLRLVLLHEMAHIKRGDLWTQLPGLFACALYWFNPFVWILHRSLCREREFACDSLVVRSGANAEEYAEHLVDIAASRLHPAAAIPMAGDPSQLESRVLRLLSDAGRRRGDLMPVGILLVTMLSSGILAIAAARITGTENASTTPKADPNTSASTELDRQPAASSGTTAWTQEEIHRRLQANPFPAEG